MNTTIANSAGAIRVRLAIAQGQVADVEIASTRRTDLARRLFVGRSVDYLLETLPLILSVCATAQAAAAVRACESAVGIRAAPVQERARNLLVLTETAREHLLRILLGWSEWLQSPTPAASLKVVGRMRGAWHAALYPDADGFQIGGGRLRPDRDALAKSLEDLNTTVGDALGEGAETWLASIDRASGLRAWSRAGDSLAQRLIRTVLANGWGRLGKSAVEPLPKLPEEALVSLFTDAAAKRFTAMPEWEAAPRETGALEREAQRPLIASLQREYGNGLLTRLAARLTEMASIPVRIATLGKGLTPDTPVPAADAATGSGLSQVEAARGRLIHWVRLEAGMVADYRILAPTEWNFHPRGALSSALATLSANDGVSRLARLLVDAVDPCVESQIEVVANA